MTVSTNQLKALKIIAKEGKPMSPTEVGVKMKTSIGSESATACNALKALAEKKFVKKTVKLVPGTRRKRVEYTLLKKGEKAAA